MGSGGRRGPSCARRARRHRSAPGRSRRAPRRRRARPRAGPAAAPPRASAARPWRRAARRGRWRRWRSRRGSPRRSCGPRGGCGGDGPDRPRAGRAGTRRGPLPRRRGLRAPGACPLRPGRPARARSRRRSPCRRAPGCGRCSRSSSRRPRVSSSSSPRSTKRPSSNGSNSSSGAPSPGAQVYVRPSTPSVSASCEEANPPLVEAKLAHEVVERLLRHLAVALVPGHEPAVQVGRGEQRVVVEHLLEVRHEPALVDRVAMEAAADQVVHASGGHAVEGLRGQVGLPAPQQQLDRGGRRELRSAAEAAPLRVGQLRQPPRRLVEQRLGQRLGGRIGRGGLLERIDQQPRPLGHLLAPLAVEVGDGDEQLRGRPASHASARAGSRCRRGTARPRR